MDKSTVKERLKEFILHEQLSQKKFETIIGVSNGFVNNISKGIGADKLQSILYHFPNLSQTWLLTGEGEMLLPSTFISEVPPVPEENYIMVEYADLRASAGKLGGSDVTALPDTRRRLVPREYETGKYLVIRVAGDSMNDGTTRSLCDGDEVLIKEREPHEWDSLPIRNSLFTITSREGNVVKQITELNKEEGYILCHSFNPSYPDYKINFEDIYQIFLVCKIVQKQVVI